MIGVVTKVRIDDLVQEPIAASKTHLDPERVAFYMEKLDDSAPVALRVAQWRRSR